MKRPAILLTTMLLAAAACPGLARTAAAGETLGLVHWPEFQQAGCLITGTVVPPGGDTKFDSLLVENTQAIATTITVLIIPDPKITKPRYAIRGQVRYEAVEGKAYLEMWNHFPADERYFTRTLAASGPMQHLEGSSDWRPFVLPFLIESPKGPQKLVLNVVLPGKGKVWLGPLSLVQYDQNEDPLAAPSQWWAGRQGWLFSAICGLLFGCLGALVGILSSCGKARGFVLGLMKVMFVTGLAALVLAVVAMVLSQPYAVYYPPLLTGLLMTTLPIALIRWARKQYEQIELRKMQAMDA